MKKIIFFVSALLISNFLHANVIKNSTTEETVQQQVIIEKSPEEIFSQKSKESIKKQLFSRSTKTYFISKKELSRYYRVFDYQLIWIDNNGTVKDIAIDLLKKVKSDPVLKPYANKVFKLDSISYFLNRLETDNSDYIQNLTKIDFILTDIYDKYMTYLSKGFINWRAFKKELRLLEEDEILADWEKVSPNEDKRQLLFRAINENNIEAATSRVDFTYPGAKELSKKILEFEQLALDGGYTKIPKVKTIRPGARSYVIKYVRQRLLESGDLKEDNCKYTETVNTPVAQDETEPKLNAKNTKNQLAKQKRCYETYNSEVKQALISFQKSHGLSPDGVLGPNTIRHLNVSVKEKIAKMRLNLERMRWLPRTLGDKFLLVNIPDYKLKMFNKGEVTLDMRIVVGERKNPTPIFSHEVSYIVLNPYWRIPPRITKREIIPKLAKNPGYLDNKDIQLHESWDPNSESFDHKTIDWTAYLDEEGKPLDNHELPVYKFIQLPSNKNPLGRMKFMFPNKYSVYLHDSPAKRYFSYSKRAYSHGCVRLAEPKKLLAAIAEEDDNVDFEKANDVLKEIEKTHMGLNKRIPVHMVYITSWVDENGNLQFRDDVYRYDRMQKKILFKNRKYM